MSKLFKSKFLVGVMVVAVMAVASVAKTADAQTTVVVAPAFTYSGVMKVGMSGPGISTLQAALNSVQSSPQIVVDGAFGPATKSAVVKFQMTKGLTPDGVVGPMTGNALAQATVAVITVPSGNLPAGCTSTAGYSSTTGVKCDSGSAGLPAGCTSTAGYSSTTGAKCDGGSSPVNNGVLGGDEGDIESVNEVSSDDSDVEEGAAGEIFAFEAEIEGDVMIDRVDFYMEVVNSGSGSEDADDYFSSAILMVDGEEVAEVDVEDFDQENYDNVTNGATPDDEYRVRFSGLDLVFSDGDEPEFVLAMVGNNTIDSDDLNEDWTVSLETDSIRFVDGKGFTGDAGISAEETFGFEEEGAGEDLTFKSASSDSINDDETLLVEDDDDSEWYEVFKFRLEAEENDIDLNELVLLVETSTHTYDAVVDDVFITIDGDDFDDFDVAAGGTDTATLTFDIDGDYTVEADDTVDVVVSMRFNSSAGYTAGTTNVVVSTVSLEGEGASDVDDTATIAGGTKLLSLSTAAITDYSWSVSSTGSIVDFFFTVEADEDDFDVLSASILDSKAGTATGPTDTSVLPETSDFGVLTRFSGDSVTTLGGAGTETGFRVAEGDTVTFRVRYNFTGNNGTWAEMTITSVAGQEVPDNKETSPTATRNVAAS